LPHCYQNSNIHKANPLLNLSLASLLMFSHSEYAEADTSFSPYATVIIDSSQVLNGGIARDFTSRLLFDGGVNYQWDQHSVFISYQAQRGDIGSDSVGDIQAYSNIDEDDFSRLYEAFYQFEGDGWFTRIGKTDANSEFAGPDNAGNFINSSMGFSPTIVAFPTYPSPALSVITGFNFSENVDIAAGIYASQQYDDFSEQFYVLELRYQMSDLSKLKFGIWHDTNSYDLLGTDEETRQGTSGYYLIYDKTLSSAHWLGAEKTNWYSQFAYADETISEITWHFGTGLEFFAPFGHSEHSLGVGLSYVKLSTMLADNVSSETALETFYVWPVSDKLVVKPDLQYIISPSGNQDIDNALVVTLRLEFNF
jgi:porin